nr:hypothetical protein [Tanacetum cinerariifolium]
MDLQNLTLAKIPILDTGKFEQWQFRIQQYLQYEHYALWEVIEFGDSYVVRERATTKGTASAATTDTASDATENHALIADEETLTEFSLMAKTSAESQVFDNSLCSNDCRKVTDSLNSKITDLTDKLFDAKNMICHYKLGLAQVESRLVEHKDHEIKYCEKIRGLEYKTEPSKDYIESLKKLVELIKKEKEELETKLTGFKTASKDLDSLLESQRMDKNKEGLGYSVVPPP